MVVVTSLGPPEEGIRLTQPGTKCFMNKQPLGRGTLYISEARVTWVGDIGHTFSLEYPHICMHAVSKDVAAFPNEEHLYLMIDVRLVNSDSSITPSSTPESSGDENDGDSDGGSTEIRFVPEDKTKLNDMFLAMNHCQALHPDENLSSDDDFGGAADGGEDEDYEEDDGQHHPVIAEEDGMFEDAEEDDEPPANGHNDPMDQ